MEGGLVACFVVLVLETLQYLNRRRGITSLFFLPGWVVSVRGHFTLSLQDFARCVAEINVLAVTSAGHYLVPRCCGVEALNA